MKLILLYLVLFFLSIFFIYLTNIEHFNVTFTPYIIDYYRQPGYSNYFYHNNYMYPLF